MMKDDREKEILHKINLLGQLLADTKLTVELIRLDLKKHIKQTDEVDKENV